MGREVQKEGAYVYLWLIHVDLWQKPTQFCKAIILQLKINKFKIKKKKRSAPGGESLWVPCSWHERHFLAQSRHLIIIC